MESSIFFITGELRSENSINLKLVDELSKDSKIGKKPRRRIPLMKPLTALPIASSVASRAAPEKTTSRIFTNKGCTRAKMHDEATRSRRLPLILIALTPVIPENSEKRNGPEVNPVAHRTASERIKDMQTPTRRETSIATSIESKAVGITRIISRL